VGAGIWNGFDVERGSCPWFASGFRTGANQTASVAVDVADLDASGRAPSSDAAHLQRGSRDDARSSISTVCQLFLAATLELRRVWGRDVNERQDKSGRIRIRCSAANENGTCRDAKTFIWRQWRMWFLAGLQAEMRNPRVIAEYVWACHEE
jgi:hypothetical protein